MYFIIDLNFAHIAECLETEYLYPDIWEGKMIRKYLKPQIRKAVCICFVFPVAWKVLTL